MDDDARLLKEFVGNQSEAAFAQLVRQHIDLVYSAALRQLGGDAARAQDATQAVFCELARKAPELVRHQSVSGWLYQCARFIAARAQRAETRRSAREYTFVMNQSVESSAPDRTWREIGSVLDDAMQELPAQDREAVLLCYFQNKPLVEIGARFGLSANAARMRVERALEKLRRALGRRGINSTSSVLGAVLAAHAIGPAPAGLAAMVIGPAVAGAAAGAVTTGIGINLLPFMISTKLKAGIIGLALAGATTAYVVNEHSADQLRARVLALDAETARLKSENARLARPAFDAGELARLRAEHSELLGLRAKVNELRRELAAAQARAQALAAQARPEVKPEPVREQQEQERIKNLGIAKMEVAKRWGLAFHLYAEENAGQMPGSFEQADRHRPQSVAPEEDWIFTLFSESDFEITFQGPLRAIQNPAQAIVMREKQPFHTYDDGAAIRTYLFADGHTEIHKAKTGNFQAFEEGRQPIVRERAAP